MSEQHYRVIADRDKGDDPTWNDVHGGDRVTMTAGDISTFRSDEIVRIERPVPTTDEPEDETQDLRTQVANLVPLSMLDGRDPRANVFEVADEIISAVLAAIAPTLPTREQIAAMLSAHRIAGVSGFGIESIACSCNRTWVPALEYREHMADAVLALLQKGADR